MSKIYANPFRWGKAVSGSHYIARSAEQDQIWTALEKQIHLIITGQRGTGKTSLLRHTLGKSSIPSVYLDLSFVLSREDLINLLLDALVKGFPELTQSEQVKLLRPENGTGAFTPVFDLWYDQVKASGHKFILVWDEFQHVVRLKDHILEDLKVDLRDRRDITHVFVSHRQDILHDIFDDKLNPFFKSKAILVLNNIETKAFNRFLTQRFRRMGLSDFDLADTVLKFTEGQPQMTQKFAHTLAELWLEGSSTRLMERTMKKMLENHETTFTTWWDSFGLNEKRLFMGLASGFSHPTELEFIKRFKLSATSTVHNTVLKLLREGWLINRDEGYHIYNPLFVKWLQQGKGLT